MRKLIFLTMLAVISACAVQPEPVVAPPPPAAPPPPPAEGVTAVPAGGFPDLEDAVVGRDYLLPDEAYRPARDNLPFGVILLRAGDGERNAAVCESFVRDIEIVPEIQAADDRRNIIATYWMLVRELSSDELVDCEKLLAHYDYSRAYEILGGYRHQDATGPVFLTLQLNADIPDEGPYVFLLNLSDESPEQVGTITRNWFDVVVARSGGESADDDVETDRRGFFRRAFAALATIAGRMACSISGVDTAESTVSWYDPVLDLAGTAIRGRISTPDGGKQAMWPAAVQTLASLLCRPGSETAAIPNAEPTTVSSQIVEGRTAG